MNIEQNDEVADSLERLLSVGPATDIFRAEQALGITNVIGDNAQGVNRSTFVSALAAIQAFAIEQFVLAINKLFERPNRQYPLQSLPAIVQFALENVERLSLRQPAHNKGLKRIGVPLDDLASLNERMARLLVLTTLQAAMPTPETDPALSALKALRDKKLAHPERIEVNKIPKTSWEHAERLLSTAKDMVGILAAYTDTAYVYNDGEYIATYDAEVTSTSLRRLLRAVGIDRPELDGS